MRYLLILPFMCVLLTWSTQAVGSGQVAKIDPRYIERQRDVIRNAFGGDAVALMGKVAKSCYGNAVKHQELVAKGHPKADAFYNRALSSCYKTMQRALPLAGVRLQCITKCVKFPENGDECAIMCVDPTKPIPIENDK